MGKPQNFGSFSQKFKSHLRKCIRTLLSDRRDQLALPAPIMKLYYWLEFLLSFVQRKWGIVEGGQVIIKSRDTDKEKQHPHKQEGTRIKQKAKCGNPGERICLN